MLISTAAPSDPPTNSVEIKNPSFSFTKLWSASFDKQKPHLSCDMDNFLYGALDNYEEHRGANNGGFIVSNGAMS